MTTQMTSETKIQIEEIIEAEVGVTTDYEMLADEVADGEHEELFNVLLALLEEDIPYGALTGDDMTTSEWIAEVIAALD